MHQNGRHDHIIGDLMAGYSVESLESGIEAAKKNIGVFEGAITKERNTITEYHDMISTIQRKEREHNDTQV